MEKTVHVGDCVVWVDPVARPFQALVTAVWGPTCINVVLVSEDKSKEDVYGRQIERRTSQSHKSVTPAHGNYWMFADETQNPVVGKVE